MDESRTPKRADAEEPRPDVSKEELDRQKGEALPKREAMSAFRPPGWQFEEPVDLLPGSDTIPPPPEE
jgi:hypothetical protein